MMRVNTSGQREIQEPSVRCRVMVGLAAGTLLLALALVLAALSGLIPTEPRPVGLPGGPVETIAAHPTSPRVLVVSFGAQAHLSDDGGSTWQLVPYPRAAGRVTQFLFSQDDALFAAGTDGLSVTLDRGRTWQEIGVFRGLEFAALASAADGATYAIADHRLWRSHEPGATWAELVTPPDAGTPHALAPHPASPQVLYMGAAGGLYVSGDRGATWYPVRPDVPNEPIHWVAAATSDGVTRLLASGAERAWLSVDDGVTWAQLAPPAAWMQGRERDLVMALPPQKQAMLVAWAALSGEPTPRLPALAPYERLLSAAAAPGDPLGLYLGTSQSLYAAQDRGRSWNDLSRQGEQPVARVTLTGDALMALPPYLIGVGFLLGLAAAGMFWSERRQPPEPNAARIERADEGWDEIIANALLAHHRVTPQVLEGIPAQAREHAMIHFVDAHRDQALVFHDAPPLISPVRNEKLRIFTDTWAALVRDLGNPENAIASASHLIEQLCALLGFEPVERRVYRSLAGYMVEAPTLRLSLPARFPIILILKNELAREDVLDIRALMSALNAVSFFALLIPVGDPAEGALTLHARQSLMRQGAEDLIVLDYRDLFGLYLAADAESDLVRRILGQVDLTVVSPYVLSGPVPPRMFFGRDYEIKLIMRTVQERSFAIVGGRKIGKTSILNSVHRLLQHTGGFAPLYLDCHHVTTYQGFFEALSVMCEMSVESAAPDLLRRIIVRLRGRQGDPMRTLVFLLDEVDHLLRFDLEHGTQLFRVFRSLSQEGLCRFVFCGERVLDGAIRDPNSPLFNFCSTLRLGYLQERDVERIVKEPMQELGISFEAPESASREIVALSGCHPNIVQAICQLLIERINQRRERVIRAEDLRRVGNSSEFRELFLEVSWGNATLLERLVTVLMAGHESFTPQQVRQALYGVGIALSDVEVETALNGLALASLIKHRGSHLAYASAAFSRVLGEAGLAEGLREGLVAKLIEEQG